MKIAKDKAADAEVLFEANEVNKGKLDRLRAKSN